MITVQLNGKSYKASFPNLTSMKSLQSGLNTLNKELYRIQKLEALQNTNPSAYADEIEKNGIGIVNINPDAIQGASDYVFHAIQRHHPDFTQKELEDNIDYPTLLQIYGSLMNMLNLPKMESDEPGELTGTPLSSEPPVSQDGAQIPLEMNSTSQDSSDSMTNGDSSHQLPSS